jgi:hypothetical protein
MNALKERVGNKRIFLYGAGNLGKRLYGFLKGQKIEVEYFLDKSSTSLFIEELKVINPFIEEIDTREAIVIVSIFNRDVNFIDLKEQRIITHINNREIFDRQ